MLNIEIFLQMLVINYGLSINPSRLENNNNLYQIVFSLLMQLKVLYVYFNPNQYCSVDVVTFPHASHVDERQRAATHFNDGGRTSSIVEFIIWRTLCLQQLFSAAIRNTSFYLAYASDVGSIDRVFADQWALRFSH